MALIVRIRKKEKEREKEKREERERERERKREKTGVGAYTARVTGFEGKGGAKLESNNHLQWKRQTKQYRRD